MKPLELKEPTECCSSPTPLWVVAICGDGRQVGSPTVLKFIKDNQPLLGCSGHIHESPYQRGGRWMAQVGRTVWVQPGQMGQRLHHVSVELGDGLEVMGIRHSIISSAIPGI